MSAFEIICLVCGGLFGCYMAGYIAALIMVHISRLR